MALKPQLTDYVGLIMQLFERFMQHRISQQGVHPSKPFTYSTDTFIIFFMLMQFRGIYAFKTQRRWLIHHPEVLALLGWQQPPHRTTIARRYKALYEVIEAFVLFIGQYAADLSVHFNATDLVIDKSVFKAHGPGLASNGPQSRSRASTSTQLGHLSNLEVKVSTMAGSMAMDFILSAHKARSQP